jgi:hypothetical protein
LLGLLVVVLVQLAVHYYSLRVIGCDDSELKCLLLCLVTLSGLLVFAAVAHVAIVFTLAASLRRCRAPLLRTRSPTNRAALPKRCRYCDVHCGGRRHSSFEPPEHLPASLARGAVATRKGCGQCLGVSQHFEVSIGRHLNVLSVGKAKRLPTPHARLRSEHHMRPPPGKPQFVAWKNDEGVLESAA